MDTELETCVYFGAELSETETVEKNEMHLMSSVLAVFTYVLRWYSLCIIIHKVSVNLLFADF
jgi:hypothetical protein